MLPRYSSKCQLQAEDFDLLFLQLVSFRLAEIFVGNLIDRTRGWTKAGFRLDSRYVQTITLRDLLEHNTMVCASNEYLVSIRNNVVVQSTIRFNVLLLFHVEHFYLNSVYSTLRK